MHVIGCFRDQFRPRQTQGRRTRPGKGRSRIPGVGQRGDPVLVVTILAANAIRTRRTGAQSAVNDAEVGRPLAGARKKRHRGDQKEKQTTERTIEIQHENQSFMEIDPETRNR